MSRLVPSNNPARRISPDVESVGMVLCPVHMARIKSVSAIPSALQSVGPGGGMESSLLIPNAADPKAAQKQAKAEGKCQVDVAKATKKCQDAKLKEFIKCKKNGLKGKTDPLKVPDPNDSPFDDQTLVIE